MPFNDFNTLRPIQNGHHFPDDIFRCIFLNENLWISIKILLKFVPKGPINSIPALVMIMAWHRPGDKPLSEPMPVSLPTHLCVTQPQWVNSPPPGQNGHLLADDIFKCIFVNEMFCILVIGYWQWPSTGSDNGLVPNRRQAIFWTNADLIHWRIYAALGGGYLYLETLWNDEKDMTFLGPFFEYNLLVIRVIRITLDPPGHLLGLLTMGETALVFHTHWIKRQHYVLKFSPNVSTIYTVPPHWHNTGSRNPSSCKTRTYLFYIVNIMGADVLATQGASCASFWWIFL